MAHRKGRGLKRLEREIIAHMRLAIAHLNGDLSIVARERNAAHELFADSALEWPKWADEFGLLYNEMLAIYRAHTPILRGHLRTTHIEIGFTGFPLTRWIPDKVQPVPPTAVELLERFDRLIAAWNGSEEVA